jgi:hypothetical protein
MEIRIVRVVQLARQRRRTAKIVELARHTRCANMRNRVPLEAARHIDN